MIAVGELESPKEDDEDINENKICELLLVDIITDSKYLIQNYYFKNKNDRIKIQKAFNLLNEIKTKYIKKWIKQAN